MPLVDNSWYVNFGNGSSTGYYAVTQWATGAVIAAGALRRQLAAPAVGSERVFVCVVAGTTHASTEPTWTLTRGALTTDNTVTWQECTGIAALNGDATNTPSWTVTATPPGGVKNTAVVLGQVIKRDNGASYQICTTAGTAGNGAEPAFSNTAGTTTADNTVTWTSLGVVGNFTGWQAPHARLANAYATNWVQAGNSVFVGGNHAETKAAAQALSAGSTALPVIVYSVDQTGSVPPVSANLNAIASVSSTGNVSDTFGTNSSGANAYYRGITFNHGSGANNVTVSFGVSNGGNNTLIFDQCTHVLVATGSTARFEVGQTGCQGDRLQFLNTVFKFGAVGQSIYVGGSGEWRGGSVDAGGSIPTFLFSQTNAPPGRMLIQGVDLSALGSGNTIAGAAVNSGRRLTFVDCKLGASVTKAATPSQRGSLTDFIRCDSGAGNYIHERYAYDGTQTVETTIVRTGGATDGTTPHSWKIVTTVGSAWIEPFESQTIRIWNDVTAANVTVTVYGIWGGGAVPNNDEIWIEVEYLGASGNPQGSFKTSTKADNLAVGSAIASDGSTWGGSTTAFKMVAVLTSPQPAQKGYINIVVKAAKISSTFYIDPKPVLT